jgi:alginate O-acetyltransferase complex protein AlgJ
MKYKPGQIFIIIVFFATIFLPLCFSNTIGGGISRSENRYLAAFPTLFTEDLKLASGFRSGMENWIKDNSGGRDQALQIYNSILYNVFHVVPEQDVWEGKDGWLYLVPSFDAPQCLHTNIPSAEHMDVLRTRFSKISSDLKKSNISYSVMLFPYKCNIYPEFAPDVLREPNTPSAIEVMENSLSGDASFDFSTPVDALRTAKNNHPVYYQAYDRDHWNQYGAFVAYSVMMERVKEHIPSIKILTNKDFTITTTIKETNTSWGFHSTEEDLQYSLIGGYKGNSDKSYFSTFPFSSKDQWKSYNYYKNPDSSLPRAVVVGDSFVWMFMLPNLSESFSELVFIHFSDLENLNAVIAKVKPDIVIEAGLGSEVDWFATYDYLPAN